MFPKKPPMGFNTWNTFAENISDEMIRQTADAMGEKGLLAAGYERRDVAVGSIYATGFNVCYLEEYGGTKTPMVINLEAGGFDKVGTNAFDRALDAASEQQGTQRLEKMLLDLPQVLLPQQLHIFGGHKAALARQGVDESRRRQLLIGALGGDHADAQIPCQVPDGGQGLVLAQGDDGNWVLHGVIHDEWTP